MSVTERYVGTGEAAEAVGVSPDSLLRWFYAGKVTPAYVTPGQHARWVIEDLRQQLGLPPESPEPAPES